MSISKLGLLFVAAIACATVSSAHAFAHRSADDATIESAVEAQLRSCPELDSGYLIEAQAIDHVVYLHGLVDTYRQKLLAQSIANQTPGVSRVVNSIEMQNQ
jgi:osmotically-inducible protein OsmY